MNACFLMRVIHKQAKHMHDKTRAYKQAFTLQ